MKQIHIYCKEEHVSVLQYFLEVVLGNMTFQGCEESLFWLCVTTVGFFLLQDYFLYLNLLISFFLLFFGCCCSGKYLRAELQAWRQSVFSLSLSFSSIWSCVFVRDRTQTNRLCVSECSEWRCVVSFFIFNSLFFLNRRITVERQILHLNTGH